MRIRNDLWLAYALILLHVLVGSSAQAVRIPGIYHTGVDDNGTPLGDRVDDPHYEIISGPAGEPIDDETIVDGEFPIGPWFPNDGSSRWIGPVDGGESDGNVDPGTLFFQTTFEMNGLDPNNAAIVGRWATDNTGEGIFLNGTSIPVQSPPGFDLSGIRTFGIGSNSGAFLDDENTLVFHVENAPPGVNPAGLRVFEIYAEAAPLGTVPIPGLRNTGVDEDGALLPDDATDPNYTITVAPEGAILPAAASGAPPSPPWVSNTGSSRWIAPSNDSNGNAPPGVYQYEINFDLTDLDPESAVITGLWSHDNGGNEADRSADIMLNGLPVGIEQMGSFPQLTRFDISTAAGHVFNAGSNTLTFTVTNAGEAANPTGLRVEGLVAYATELGGVVDGDFDNDGEYTCADIDSLYAAIRTEQTDLDLTNDGVVDGDDINQWLVEAGDAKGYSGAILSGDANLDGRVTSDDLNAVGVQWQSSDVLSWCQGDFNADQNVDSLDLNDVGVHWQESILPEGAQPVPEPSSLVPLFAALSIFLRRRAE